MNINRLLENSKRVSLIGRNIYTFEGFHKGGKWDLPRPGFAGRLAIGHEIPVCDTVVPEFFEGGKKLDFSPVRHRWTPAWMKTYYRSAVDEAYYPNSGCFALCETKCIDTKDAFVARIEIRNDKRETAEIRVKLTTPFEGEDICLPVRIGALGCDLELKGFWTLKNSLGDSDELLLRVPPHGAAEFSYAFAFSKESLERAEELASQALAAGDPFAEKERWFNEFMRENAPELVCEDMDMLKAYYYRWFLVYRALHRPSDVIGGHPVEGDCLYESPYGGWYGSPVGLPVPHHLEEAKWMISPEVPFADAGNWAKKLACYQGFGYIQYTPMAIWHLYENHPDRGFLEKVYPACREYALGVFDSEKDGVAFLPTIDSSWPTGAEYQPAFYQHTQTPWDWTQDNEGRSKGIATEELRLYRLDHICYSIGNLIGSAKMAAELGRTEEEGELSRLARRAIEAIKKDFWSEEKKCFVSIDAVTGKPCDDSLCYDSFFPFLWGMVGSEYFEGWKPLLDEKDFACDFSLTSADKQCPMYWFDNCIAGPTKSSLSEPHPYGCCWNGPVWPYATSAVAEALGRAAVDEKTLRGEWMRLFEGYTELHFMEGDRSTPMITEHYRQTDGVSFSETCDYFHSTWIDLFMKYWAGVQVSDAGVAFEPFTACEFELKHVRVGGKTYALAQRYENGELKRTIIEE